MALIVLAAALLMGVAAFLWLRRPTNTNIGTSWVAAREGLVEFSPVGTRCVPWASVSGAVLSGDEVQLQLESAPVVHEYPLGAARFEPLPHPVRLRAEMLANAPAERFVDMVTLATTDESARKRLPTFEFPEGPPEAVLAGVTDLPGSEGRLG